MPKTLSELISLKNSLVEQQASLDKEIAQARRAERQDVIQKILGMLAEHDLTVDDLGPSRSPKKRKKVAPKFRDPVSGKTWTGRGIKPRWVAEGLAAGKALEDFAIE